MELSKYIEFIKIKHAGQTRKQGTPYYLHPVAVCEYLTQKGFSINYQITALFHDLLEDTNTTYDEILNISNKQIAEAVKPLTKEEGYEMSDYIERIKNNDIAKMVKLADRLHNLSESHKASLKFQEKYIKETEEWYIELAKNTVFEKDITCTLNKLKEFYNANK